MKLRKSLHVFFIFAFSGFALVILLSRYSVWTVEDAVELGVYYEPKLSVTEKSREYIGEVETLSASTGDYQRVRVLVAGDEDMTSPTWSFFGDNLDWHQYVWWQTGYASYYLDQKFSIVLSIEAYETWISSNTMKVSREMLEDAARQVGWPRVGFDIFIAWTGQYNDDLFAGVAIDDKSNSWYPNSVLVQPQADWADDNLIQHEVSHLYHAPDHIFETDDGYWDDCIMTYRIEFYETITDQGYIIPINDYAPVMYATHNYHQECQETIESNRFKFGLYIPAPPHSSADTSTGGGCSGVPKPW